MPRTNAKTQKRLPSEPSDDKLASALFDKDCEKTVLGTLIKAEDTRRWIAELSEDDFYLDGHRRLFAIIRQKYTAGAPLDLKTVAEDVVAENLHPQPLSWLMELEAAAYSPNLPRLNETYMKHFVERLHQYRNRRRLTNFLYGSLDRIVQREDPWELALDLSANLREFLVQSRNGKSMVRSVGQILEERGVNQILGDDASTLCPWPWNSLNALIGPVRKAEVIIVAGRPGAGKSAFALQMLTELAKRGLGCLFVSLEMFADDLLRRMASMASSEPLKIGSKPNETGRKKLLEAVNQMVDLPLRFSEFKGHTPAAFRAVIEEALATGPLNAVALDYVQLMESGKHLSSRNEELTAVSRALHSIASEYGITLLLCSQLSRGSSKDGREPDMHDLRDSGALEQDADVILFLHKIKARSTRNVHCVRVIVAKNRFGPVDQIELDFDAPACKFEEVG